LEVTLDDPDAAADDDDDDVDVLEAAFGGKGDDALDCGATEGLLSLRNSFESFKLPFIFIPLLPRKPALWNPLS
jgi:hypothetical protein